MIARTLRTAPVLLVVSCFCERCGEDTLSDSLSIQVELGDLGPDCTGSDQLTTEAGSFEVTYAVETGTDGVELCTVLATWEDGTLFDFAGTGDGVSVEGTPLPLKYFVERMTIPQVDLLRLAYIGGTPVDPVGAELRLALGSTTLDVSSDDVFAPDSGALVFEKARGDSLAVIEVPPYGPADPQDFRYGPWPLLDDANDAFVAESTLGVSGRARISFPLSELADVQQADPFTLQLDTGVTFQVGAYACQQPFLE